MKTREVTMPEIGLIAATRGMLGAGIALLLADRLNKDRRKTLGWALLGIGVASTIPLAIRVMRRKNSETPHASPGSHQFIDGEPVGSWASDRGLD